jgi:hypothetical protein
VPLVLSETETDCPSFKLVHFSDSTGKYLELWTIWRAEADGHVAIGLSAGTWCPRPIGILFSKRNIWTFLVLVVLISAKDDPALQLSRRSLFPGREEPAQFQFCIRRPKKELNLGDTDKPFEWEPSELSLCNLVEYMAQETRKTQNHHIHFLERMLEDIFWGWERYLVVVRNDIRAVCALPPNPSARASTDVM